MSWPWEQSPEALGEAGSLRGDGNRDGIGMRRRMETRNGMRGVGTMMWMGSGMRVRMGRWE